ncbi:MAG: aminotransferase class IV [Balneolaceae bacterium]|nr:aminotransferase class IV [Balneolaceae bacterium]
MGTEKKLIFDGDFVSTEETVVPAVSRGLMYGDGCFETLRSYAGCFLHLREHLQRFKLASDFLGLDFPLFFDDAKLKSSLEKLLVKNGLATVDAIIRFQLWRDGTRGYRAEQQGATHFSIMASKLPSIKDSIKLAFVDTKRIPDASLPSAFKLSNNINYIVAAREAAEKGADDALMQTVDGYLSETTIANLFWSADDVIYTPSEDCDLLPGITRNVLINICQQTGFTVKQGRYTSKEILKAEAVWICNSVREIVHVSQIEDKEFEVNHWAVNRLKEKFEGYKKQKLAK